MMRLYASIDGYRGHTENTETKVGSTMVIWQRWGILAFFSMVFGALLGSGIAGVLFPGSSSSGIAESGQWLVSAGIGELIFAVLLWLFENRVIGHYIDKPQPVYNHYALEEPYTDHNGTVHHYQVSQAIDLRTGEPQTSQPRSSLFFIPLRFWPYIQAGLGVTLLLLGFTS